MTVDKREREQTTVSNGDVVVNRELTSKDQGIVGAIEIRSQRDDPVLVHVVDEYPDDVPVDSVAFKPGTEPDAGDITDERVSIKHPVEDDAVRVVYGIQVSEQVDGVEFDPPTIRDVEVIDLVRSTPSKTDGGTEQAATTDDPSKSAGFFSRVQAKLKNDADDDRQDISTDDNQRDSPSDDSQLDGPSDDDVEEEVTEDLDLELDDERDADVAAEPEDTTEESSRGEISPEGPAESEDSTEKPAEPVDSSDSEQSMPRSVEVRLDRLGARVEEFAAYASALEDLIDEHGTATEFVDRIERDLADVESRLRDVRDDVTALRDDHDEDVDDLRQTTAAIERRLDDVRSEFDEEVETVREEMADVEDSVDRVGSTVRRIETDVSEHESDLESVTSDVETLDERVDEITDDVASVRDSVRAVERDVGTVSDEVSAMRDELEALRTEVADLREVHDTLATAFGAGNETAASGASGSSAAQHAGTEQRVPDDGKLELDD